VLKPRRPEILLFLVAAFLALALNYAFWRRFLAVVAPHSPGQWLFFAAALVTMVLITYLLLLAFSVKPVLRIIVAILLPVSAAASYFMNEYGVVIDVNMVRNVLETDTREAGDLITIGMVAYIGLLGVLPAVLFCRIPWRTRTFGDEALAKLKFAVPALLLLAVTVIPFWGAYLSLLREHRELKLSLTPVNYISALSKYWRVEGAKRPKVISAFGADAKRAAVPPTHTRKSLFVVVVGETARWDHFALNGYARPTNPGLSKVDGLIDYPKAFSCGTDTAQSVPCMFSGLGRADFTNAKADSQENLLDILKRAGIDVLWRENQAGCKGVCARVSTETLTGLKAPTFYPSTTNYDDILVDGLDEKIAKLEHDTVIVLHMMGSHGPAYWKRYPDKFETFTPVCKDSQFSRCQNQDIINAYDNTLVYTDHVLTRLIGVLSGAADHGVDAGMLYVSDHGESLGENFMYLHGMPYAIAPEAQIHVPMVVWLAPSMRDALGVDQACLAKSATERVSHDNLFHSVLGLMNVTTRVYHASLDLFGPCRRPAFVSGRRDVESVVK
jgi:lipid A ethanolaminephosphotransferase